MLILLDTIALLQGKERDCNSYMNILHWRYEARKSLKEHRNHFNSNEK